MSLPEVFLTTFGERMAWTLIHFLWQGAALAGILAVVLRTRLATNPETRYGLAVFTMAAMVACPLATLAMVETQTPAVVLNTQVKTLILSRRQNRWLLQWFQ